MKKKLILSVLLTFLLAGCQYLPASFSSRSMWTDDELYSSVMYEVNFRQFTPEGTFNAFSEHLPRLADLGVNILWFMPIHPISLEKRKGSLGSYYAVKDYYEVNPEFGSKQDFKNLVNKAHDLGFKVIIDWVANHTGWDNQWIVDNPEWYTQDFGKIIHPEGTDWTDVADLNFNDNDLRKEMTNAMKYWVREFDIDGFRADVAGQVPTSFWESARREIEKVKPVFMLAENEGNMRLLDFAFDTNYQFRFYGVLKDVANNKRRPSEITVALNNMKLNYKGGIFPFVYTTNHDENSWDDALPNIFKDATKAMNVLIFTIPAMPLIYNGQEINSDRSLRFFEKDLIVWDNFESNEYHLFYKQLIQLKRNNQALWHDSMNNLVSISVINDVLIYSLAKDNNKVSVIINLSNQNQVVKPILVGSFKDYFANLDLTLNSQDELVLAAKDYRVFIHL
jgi:glycosidase